MQIKPMALSPELASIGQLPLTKNTGQNSGDNISFGDTLNNAIQKVNDAQLHSSATRMQFLTSEVQDVHQVMIASQEARLLMTLSIEVRNKLVEAYRKISRMPI